MIPTDLSGPTIRGHVITPFDPAYDTARRSYNGMLDRRPKVIVRPADAADVAATVRWAAEAGVGVAVRGGGHSVAGHSIPDGACVIDLGNLRSVSVDPRTQLVEADGGCLLMDLDVATTAFGLAVPSGTFFDTGIGGLTLGGGISYILSSAGFTCDVLVGAELVTADGRIVEVDEDREPDLLWALRGGGGNFGVVTRFRYRATPVDIIQAGSLRFRGSSMAEVVDAAIALDRDGPDELATQLVFQRPTGSTELEVRVSLTWRGDAESAGPILTPFRALPGLVDDGVRSMTFLQGQARNASIPPGVRHYWKGHLVGSLPVGIGATLVDTADRAPGIDVVLVELIHGVPHRNDPATAAFGGRSAVANVTALGIWFDPAEDDAHIAWVRSLAGAVEPLSLAGGGYLNYGETDQTAGRVAAAFGASYPRLRSIKRAVDPDNLFRFNANIPPA
jgi:FAD/FMN-containing dehydrogenase